MPHFIPGVQLNAMFYREVVAPILASEFPGLCHSAALIGYGSDVLGFDSERSTDHEWGPRLVVFLGEEDHGALSGSISEVLSRRLPPEFRGYSTNFSDPDENRVRWMTPTATGRVNHHMYFHPLRDFIRGYLGIDPHQALTPVEWLLMYQSALLEVTGGEVYHDGLGELTPLRKKLEWYPRDVWLFMLASQWIRIAQEEPFQGRCAEAGDEVGSRIVAARLARDLMRLCFLMERRYAPYSKWLGSAFLRLGCGPELDPILRAALEGRSWQDRERHLCAAYEFVARMHNQMGAFPVLDTAPMTFHERPYQVLGAGRFAKAVSDQIRDERMREIYAKVGPIGSIDQFGDSTNLLMRSDLRRRLRALYEP